MTLRAEANEESTNEENCKEAFHAEKQINTYIHTYIKGHEEGARRPVGWISVRKESSRK